MSQHTDEIEKTMTMLRDVLFPKETERPKSTEERLEAIEGQLGEALKSLEELKARPYSIPFIPYIQYTPPYYPYIPPVRIGDYPNPYWRNTITCTSPTATVNSATTTLAGSPQAERLSARWVTNPDVNG